MQTVVELEGVNGEFFTLAGPNAGDKGIFLATGLDGIFDPPVKTVWEEPASLPGARFLSHRILRRDITLGVHILNDAGAGSWKRRDSDWRKAWSYEADCKLWVTTEDGRRFLSVRMGEQPRISMDTDPNERELTTAIYTLIAGDPFWYGEQEVHEFVLEDDLSNVPLIVNGELNPAAHTHVFRVPELNPTDQPVWPIWTVSSPSRVVLPDFSFEDDELARRKVVMPTLRPGENIMVDVDPRHPQITSENGAQVWARMNGVRFRSYIPAYTYEAELPVTIAQAPAGAAVQLRLIRPWSRPWGMW